MRRGKDDIKWQEVKKFVTVRDKKQCRFLKICLIKEEMLIRKLAPKSELERLDHAHIFPVSLYPEIMYDPENIVLLNRYSHHLLDDCKNPITGESITKEERNLFWIRIVGDKIYEKLSKKIVETRKKI